jgi:hypothetical protein
LTLVIEQVRADLDQEGLNKLVMGVTNRPRLLVAAQGRSIAQ